MLISVEALTKKTLFKCVCAFLVSKNKQHCLQTAFVSCV